MNFEIIQCGVRRDPRGQLVEFLRESDLPEKHKRFGQIYYVTFDSPGQVRGNHYHTRGVEWFGAVRGSVEVVLEDTRTKERAELVLNSEDPTFRRLAVGPWVAHAFRNLTPQAVLLNYCSVQYDPSDPDRNPYVLIEP